MSKAPRWVKGRPLLLSYLSLILYLLLLVNTADLSAQEIRVLDVDTSEPLVGVEVYNDSKTLSGSTDTSGVFYFERSHLSDTIHLSYLGYNPTTISLDQYKDYTVSLTQSNTLLSTFTLIGRTAALEENLPYQIRSLAAKKLKQNNPSTSADALESSGEVYIQRSQQGGGSPIIRGFEANKVLLVLDGVRLNNAIYRSGHLQNIITIDPSTIDKIDLLFGPGSLIYGSDALGGVISIKTKDPQLLLSTNEAKVRGSLFGQYATASNAFNSGVELEIRNKKWAHLSVFSYSIFGDLRAGSRRTDAYPDYGKRFFYVDPDNDQVLVNDNVNLQRGTGYNQVNLLQKWKYQLDNNRFLMLNMQLSTSSNIPRYDALTEIENISFRYSEWNYGPQLRWMNSIVYNDQSSNLISDKRILNLAYQKIGEDRITRTFGNQNRDYQEEKLDILSISYDLEKKVHHTLFQYGLEAQYNRLKSIAFSEDIFTEERTADILTRYPDNGSSTLNGGLYLLASQALLNDKLNINGGLRYSRFSYDLAYLDESIIQWPDSFYEGISESNDAFTYSLGARYKFKNTQVRALYATAFRSPNIDDIAKIRIKRDEINIPAIGLVPEESRSIELSVKQTLLDQKLELSATAYQANIENLIVSRPRPLPDGSTVLISRQDSFITVANVNAQEGTIGGLNINAAYALGDRWSAAASVNFTTGSAVLNENTIPLAHIPPTYGYVSLDYKSVYGTLRASCRFNGAKAVEDFDPSVDNLDLATPEGSLAYQVWSVFYEHKLGSYALNAGIENILDTHYRNFASGVSGTGINFSFKITKSF